MIVDNKQRIDNILFLITDLENECKSYTDKDDTWHVLRSEIAKLLMEVKELQDANNAR
jgi:hypothetical protein